MYSTQDGYKAGWVWLMDEKHMCKWMMAVDATGQRSEQNEFWNKPVLAF